MKGFCNRQYIVGYIRKERILSIKYTSEKSKKTRKTVIGNIKIVHFDPAFESKGKEILGIRFTRRELIKRNLVDLDKEETKRLLGLLDSRYDISEECVREIIRLDEKNLNRNKTCMVLRGQECRYQDSGCLRWKILRK